MDAGESKGNDGEIFSVTVPSGSRRARERGRKSLLPVGHFTLKGQNGPDTLHRRKIQRFDSKIALFTHSGILQILPTELLRLHYEWLPAAAFRH
jgi:hypothetical protein